MDNSQIPIISQAEQQAFTRWHSSQDSTRTTGWKIWFASLEYRKMSQDDIRKSRPAFDTWLENVQKQDWTEFDAWAAAATWFANRAQ